MKNSLFQDKRNIIDYILPEIPKISSYGKITAPLYKAVDGDGNIYLIPSPDKWPREKRLEPSGEMVDGKRVMKENTYLIKPKAKIHMSYIEASKSLKFKKKEADIW